MKKNTATQQRAFGSHGSPSSSRPGEEQQRVLGGDTRAHRAHAELTGSSQICKQDGSGGSGCSGKDQGVENTECDQETMSHCTVREALGNEPSAETQRWDRPA